MTTGAEVRATARQRQELAQELRKRVSGEVRFDPYSRVLYSTDASIYQMEPVGVVIPRNLEDVLAVMEVASREGVPVLPRGGGTSLAGQAVNHAIVMDFSKHMDRILAVNHEERWARVEPGIVLDQLNRQVAPFGLQYAPDPTTSNRACVGGGVGNNTCGSHSVVYGKTIDHVLELGVVLSDGSQAKLGPLDSRQLEGRLAGAGLESDIYRQVGAIAEDNRDEILSRYPRIMRRVSGYNLDDFIDGQPFNMARMVVGSEGTLCVVTDAKLNLVPIPPHKGLAVLHFHDMVQSCAAIPEILQHGPAAVELVGKMILDRCRESLGSRRLMDFVEGEPDAVLAVEFTGDSEAEVAGKLDTFKADMQRKGLGYSCVNLLGPAAQANVWALRSAGLGLLMSIRGDSKPMPYVEDTAVDPEKLGEYVRRFDEIVRAHGTTAGYYGHASVGCMHIRPLVDLKTGEGIARMEAIASEISDLVLEYGGSLSGEHGDGIVRGVWTEKMFGAKLHEAFRQVKRAFDPQNIMNPGKIVDCPPMSENLRFGAGYEAASPITMLDFSQDLGYGGAVEMCNGMGACRKTTGTMCPSFMATKEEEHSTRGRANLLRAVLSGALPGETLASPRLHQALDLCLECKACKAECQTGVDMAKLKYEFLDRYNAAHGVPLRASVFANINALSRLGSRLAPLSNWASRVPLGKLLLHRFLGIHSRRPMPPFARPSLPSWFKGRTASSGGTAGTVVLFNDTFMNYSYPQVGIAAVELLERAGFRVALASPSASSRSDAVCCGRPMISKGLLERARANARHNVDLLYPYAEQGIPIVGCEPSCLLTLRDEYPDLLRDERSRLVAGEQLPDRRVSGHAPGKRRADPGVQQHLQAGALPRPLPPEGAGRDAELHGCPRPSRGYRVEEVNSGCCGMAGSFGFEAEHYDISMAIGRQVLFPAIEAKDDDWEVAVMGVSCRQQIEHATGRRARHLVEVLRDALV